MKKSRLIGDKAVKILCWLIAVGWGLSLLMDLGVWGAVIKGDILVNFVSETGELTEGLLNGGEHQSWVRLPEQVEIAGEPDGPCRAAVTAMGINRKIFAASSIVMLIMVLINGIRGRLYSRRSVELLLWSGLIPIIAFFLLPLINVIFIPNLANLTSTARINVPDVNGILEGIPGGNGLLFILAANVLEKARISESTKQKRKKKRGEQAEAC
ncbi:MAG: hypothetical protein IJN08_02190 [Clostridia bacterium]|nr:hypothetical protein [Clostridia bacterium]